MSGEYLDLTSDTPNMAPKGESRRERRFVGIHFVCCDVYSRIYINTAATAYEGNCPKCARRVRLTVGSGGTDARFFTAG